MFMYLVCSNQEFMLRFAVIFINTFCLYHQELMVLLHQSWFRKKVVSSMLYKTYQPLQYQRYNHQQYKRQLQQYHSLSPVLPPFSLYRPMTTVVVVVSPSNNFFSLLPAPTQLPSLPPPSPPQWSQYQQRLHLCCRGWGIPQVQPQALPPPCSTCVHPALSSSRHKRP